MQLVRTRASDEQSGKSIITNKLTKSNSEINSNKQDQKKEKISDLAQSNSSKKITKKKQNSTQNQKFKWNDQNTETFYQVYALFNSLDLVHHYFKKNVDPSIKFQQIKLKFEKERKSNQTLLFGSSKKPKLREKVNQKFQFLAQQNDLSLKVRWSQVSQISSNKDAQDEEENEIQKNLSVEINELIMKKRESQKRKDNEDQNK